MLGNCQQRLLIPRMNKDLTKENFQLQFGKKIQKLRKERGLSYRKLAQQCNIDYSDLSKIEKGKVNVQLSTIVELSKGLEVHPSSLFDFDFPVQYERTDI